MQPIKTFGAKIKILVVKNQIMLAKIDDIVANIKKLLVELILLLLKF